MAHVFIDKEALDGAYLYANMLKTAPERDYANAYIRWLRGGAEGLEPQRGRLTIVRAEDIQDKIAEMKLWQHVL
jgi:hypothetical protein